MESPAGTNAAPNEETALLKQKNRELEQVVTNLSRGAAAQGAETAFMTTVLDHLHDFLLVIDPADYTILEANRTFVDFCGLTRESVIGRYCYDLTHALSAPCSTSDHRCPLKETLKTGNPATVEHIHHNGDGGKRYVEITTIPIIGKAGAIEKIIHLSRDITDRKRAEESLQKSNLELLAIIDNLPFLAWLKDGEGRFMAVNEPFARSCGRSSAGDLVGKTDLDVWPERLAEAYRADDLEVMRSRQKKAVEELIADQGAEKWFETYKAPLFGVDGYVIGTAGIARDITERKKSEEQLRVTQFAVDCAAESIAWIGKEGRYLYVNDFYRDLLGYTKEEFLSLRVFDLDPNFSAESWPLRWEKTKQRGSDVFETSRLSKNGELIPLEIHANYLSCEGKEFIVTFSRDIRERKKSEEQLQQTLESLRKAFGATVQVMVSAVETRDPYTAGHQIRVADLARAIATEMGLPQQKIDAIRMASSVHDIGKLSIPAEILSKPTKLSEIEFSLIKEHARQGYGILKNVESPWPLAEIVRQHHERIDGSGYPDRLKGEEILIEARILAVADVVEAMASHRPYRPGLGIQKALEEIDRNSGIYYDGAVAGACLRLFREKGFVLEGT